MHSAEMSPQWPKEAPGNRHTRVRGEGPSGRKQLQSDDGEGTG